jgi:preprotein translocase subunit YajC
VHGVEPARFPPRKPLPWPDALARDTRTSSAPREVIVSLPLLLTETFAAMQPEPTTGTSEPAPGAPGGGPGPAGCQSVQPLVLMAVMFGVFYFLLIRPQQKRQRELDDMLKALKRGDKVRTSGGIRGEVVELTDAEVTLLIADKVKVNVLRSHIASRIEKSSPEGKSDDAKTKPAG